MRRALKPGPRIVSECMIPVIAYGRGQPHIHIYTCSIWGLYLLPMGQKRRMWYTDLALNTFVRLADLNIL